MTVNIKRMMARLQEVGRCGALPDGGTTRLTYTQEYRAAQELLQKYASAADMSCSSDAVGNLIFTYPGKDQSLPPVLSGSHLDTVPNGGNFDGILGIISALETASSWHDEGYIPQRTLQVIATAEEEGTAFGRACFGASVLAGCCRSQQPENIKKTDGSGTLADCLRSYRLPQTALQDAARSNLQQEIAAFIELHIEQGAVLEEAGLAVGAVTHIVGYDRLHLKITGTANHSGTTAMHRRQDALAAGAAIALGAQQLARQDQRFVATVGKFQISPNVPNIVPGQAELCVETRSYDNAILAAVRPKILKLIAAAASDNNVSWQITGDFHNPAVPLDEKIISCLTEAAAELQQPIMRLPSWAGHDTQVFACSGVPSGMLFVKSVGGISHAPEEYSAPDDILTGARILEAALRRLTNK